MAYLDIPISGISLFSKVSIASEDIPLENLTCLPSKDVELTLQDHTARFLLLVYTILRDKPKNMIERC